MLYTKKFVITVSLCAMLAANPVLAVTDPVSAVAGAKSGTPGVVSTVYSDWAGRANSGIAGVTYVNNAVDAAGNAAQWAENHAAAAAQSAKSAAGSASDAAKVLEKAVLRPEDVVKEGKAVGSESLPVYVMADGTVKTITSYEGKAATAGTADKAIADQNGDQIDTTYEKVGNKVAKLSADSTDIQYPNAKLVYTELGKKVDKDQGEDYKNLAMVTDQKGTVYPGYVDTDMIADGAVTLDKISSIYPGGGVTGFLYGNGSGNGDVELFAVPGDVGPTLIGWDNGAPIAVAASDSGGVLKVEGTGVDKGIKFAQITTDDIADGAVTTDKIVDGAVTFGKIKGYQDRNYEPTTGKLLIGGENSFGWGSIHPDMITSPGDSFQTGVSGLAIVSDGLGNTYWGQVSENGIVDDAVTTYKIAAGAVTSTKIADDAVTEGKIANGAVTSGTIANGAVTTDKIAAGAVMASQIYAATGIGYFPGGLPLLMARDEGLAWGQIGSEGVADGAVTIEKTAGVVGMVPEGSPDATTYSQMWIE
ncbi:MAG: hypothetical protein J6R52_02960 [Alphaproteobacteria bacterium]|nr:hypothetical protein [Alphaproteobacteria bacterium]